LSIVALVVEVEAKAGPISESEKFRQHLFIPMYHHFQLQLERLGELFLDLFDAPNLAVASIFPWPHWLWRYRQNAENSRVKIFISRRTDFHPAFQESPVESKKD